MNESCEEECNVKHNVAETQLYVERLSIHHEEEIMILFKEDTYFFEIA